MDLVGSAPPIGENRVTPLKLSSADLGSPELESQNEDDVNKRMVDAAYMAIVEATRDIGRQIHLGGKVDLGVLARVIAPAVRNPVLGEGLFYKAFFSLSYDRKDFLTRHMVNVMAFCLHASGKLSLDFENRIRISVAAALHDLGMFTFPDEILHKAEALSEIEIKILHEHPKRGYALLRDLGSNVHDIANIVFQEHEREDGSGYPEGLSGEAIAIGAKLIAAADCFESMIGERNYRPGSIPPVKAITILAEQAGSKLSPSVIKIFLDLATPFPPTTRVQLSDGRTGMIVKVKPHSPLRPDVLLEARDKNEDEIVDLEKLTLLRLAKILPPSTMENPQ